MRVFRAPFFVLIKTWEYDNQMSNIADEIIKTIKYAVDKKATNCDRAYRTVIKRIDKNGYVIIDQAGQERTVPCGIPNVELKPMQNVYVKEPMGKINELHICNIADSTNSSNGRNRRR